MRWALLWIGCALTLAAMACEDGAAPPSPTPAEPTSTATPMVAVASADATPPASPASSAEPTSEPTPGSTPEPTATPTPTATSTPHPTPELTTAESVRITRGEPRPLPAGLALYYWVNPCTHCGGVPFDLRRVIFDEAANTLREDRPLATFDDAGDIPHYYPVRSFGVSESGQTLAVTVCHAAYCDVDPWEDPEYPDIDTELRLWVSGDGGATWRDWGELLPETRIIEVTDDDVLTETWNIWETREPWEELTDGEWQAMLLRLAPLGLDKREGWTYRYRWVASGEPADPAAVWSTRHEAGLTLAIPDHDGSVEHYIATDQRGGPSIVGDLLIRPTMRFGTSFLSAAATLEIVDLATMSTHEVEGLSLPFGLDIESAKSQRDYYHFITARPTSTAE